MSAVVCKPETEHSQEEEDSEYIYLNGVQYSVRPPDFRLISSNSKIVVSGEKEQNSEYLLAQQNKRQRVRQIETYTKEVTTDEFPEEDLPAPIPASSSEPTETVSPEMTESESAVFSYRQKRLRDGGVVRDVDWATERVAKTPVWVPVMEPWKMELERLRHETEPVNPTDCFGCAFEEYESRNAVNAARWNVLLAAFLNNLSNCGSMYNLGLELYEIFQTNVLQQLVSEQSDEAERVWSPYGLMYHFLYHNASPQIRMHILITRTQSIVNTILEHEIYELNLHSGRLRVDSNGLKKLKSATEIESQLRKIKPEELPFSTKRFQLSTENLSLLNTRIPIVGSNSSRNISPISQKKWN